MFEVGHEYRRRDLHAQYGGQGQGGISTPRSQPIILLFTSGRGEEHGYTDYWLDPDTLVYTGEGRYGDMVFVHGNVVIRDHAEDHLAREGF